nr:MAG TPA: hypothetical protein [Caudoviricetes sp.]
MFGEGQGTKAALIKPEAKTKNYCIKPPTQSRCLTQFLSVLTEF